MPLNASDARILRAAGATLQLSGQKNGWKNGCIFHQANGDEIRFPIRALGQGFIHIRAHTSKDIVSLSTYFVKGCEHHLKDTNVRAGLKFAAKECDYPARGIPIARVDTHSLRAGGANALSFNGYSDHEIQKMGRWEDGVASHSKNTLPRVCHNSVLACHDQ